MVDYAPKAAELAVDLRKDLLQMPTPLRIAAHVPSRFFPISGGEHRAKPVPRKHTVSWLMPIPPLVQEVLDIAQPIVGISRTSSQPDE